jgi:hypothetical protein
VPPPREQKAALRRAKPPPMSFHLSFSRRLQVCDFRKFGIEFLPEFIKSPILLLQKVVHILIRLKRSKAIQKIMRVHEKMSDVFQAFIGAFRTNGNDSHEFLESEEDSVVDLLQFKKWWGRFIVKSWNILFCESRNCGTVNLRFSEDGEWFCGWTRWGMISRVVCEGGVLTWRLGKGNCGARFGHWPRHFFVIEKGR